MKLILQQQIPFQPKAKTSLKGTDYLINKIANGCLLFEFYGHGSPNVFCHERVFFGGGSKFSDVKKLDNRGRLPFMLLMTCDTGHFDYAEPKWNLCIAEELMSVEKGGVIGLLASTGRGYPVHHEYFMRAFHEALFVHDIRRIGELATAVKLLFKMEQPSDDPLLMFQIFGDPKTEIRMPEVRSGLNVKPPMLQSRFGGRVLVSVNDKTKITGRLNAFISDGRGELLPEPRMLPGTISDFPVGFDVPENVFPGDCYATVFSATMEGLSLATAWVGKLEALPREPLKEAATQGAKPNLKVGSSDVTFSNFSPFNGQTVFLTVRVHNTGDAPARDVSVKAYDGDPKTGGQHLEDDVEWPFHRIELIRPGESETIRLRWDPFQNAGEHTIWVVVDQENTIVESSEDDNSASRPLVVRKKADLEITGELIWNDARLRHDLNYAIENIGEEFAKDFQLQLKGYRSEDDTDPVVRNFDVVYSVAPGKIWSGSGIGPSKNFFKVELIVDPDDIVDEETHGNNLLELMMPPPGESVSSFEPTPAPEQ